MSGLFGSKGGIAEAFNKARAARAGSKPLTGIEPPGPGVDRSQAGQTPTSVPGRRRRGRRHDLGGGRTQLAATTPLSGTAL